MLVDHGQIARLLGGVQGPGELLPELLQPMASSSTQSSGSGSGSAVTATGTTCTGAACWRSSVSLISEARRSVRAALSRVRPLLRPELLLDGQVAYVAWNACRSALAIAHLAIIHGLSTFQCPNCLSYAFSDAVAYSGRRPAR